METGDDDDGAADLELTERSEHMNPPMAPQDVKKAMPANPGNK